MKNLINHQALHSGPKKAKKDPDYARPKKAFDKVMEYYPVESRINLFGSEAERERDRQRIEADLSLRSTYAFYEEKPKKDKKGKAQGVVAAKGTPVKNTAAPSMQDFKVDVEREIIKVIKTPHHQALFVKRYLYGLEVLSKDEQHLFARFEQQIGKLFIRAKIYPLETYFISVRKERQKC